MEVLHPHCAGLDVHKESVMACIRHMVNGRVMTDVKTFKTTTQQLMALSDWLIPLLLRKTVIWRHLIRTLYSDSPY
jgi:hypothetical protein